MPFIPSVSFYVGFTKGKAGTVTDPRTYLKGVKGYPGISVREIELILGGL